MCFPAPRRGLLDGERIPFAFAKEHSHAIIAEMFDAPTRSSSAKSHLDFDGMQLGSALEVFGGEPDFVVNTPKHAI